MFTSILQDQIGMTFVSTAICTFASLILGVIISKTYVACGKHSKSFAISLVVLPVLVQIVISMVNGNLGTGVAVLGAFSLIRFRSVPGNAKDICTIFFAMAVGIATGTGYVSFAFFVTMVICIVMLILSKVNYGSEDYKNKELKITIPENLDYTNVFDDIFEKYTKTFELTSTKTTNLGSMFQLTYSIELKDIKEEKNFIDELRCRNGNLTILCGNQSTVSSTL